MNKYRITVIGAGDRGNVYMNMLAKYYADSIEFVTICDLQQDRLEQAYGKFGFRYKTQSWENAIKEHQADIVVIATPAYFHCDIAIFAMRCGSHVLTEKPLDIDLKKCFAVREVEAATGKKMAVGMQYRYVKNHRSLKRAIESGIFGGNMMIHYTDMREVRPKIAMHDASRGNGGPMVDMACHLFDLMRWYYGSDPEYVSCEWRQNALDRPTLVSIADKAADACFMTVKYKVGSLGSIMMNWGLPTGYKGIFTQTVTGKNAVMLKADGDGVDVQIGEEVRRFEPLPEDADDIICPERSVFEHLVEAIENDTPVQVGTEHGLVCLATSMAALRSGRLGRPVSLDEIYRIKPTIYESMTIGE